MARRANDEGSVWRRADGRWSGAYFVPKPGGGRVRRYVYGPTREATHAKLVDLMALVGRGVPIPSGTTTVQGSLREWLDTGAAKRVRPNTLEGYRTNVERHIVPKLGARRLGRLTVRDVRTLLEDCRGK